MHRSKGFYKLITMRLQQSVMKKKINKRSNSERLLCMSVIAVFSVIFKLWAAIPYTTSLTQDNSVELMFLYFIIVGTQFEDLEQTNRFILSMLVGITKFIGVRIQMAAVQHNFSCRLWDLPFRVEKQFFVDICSFIQT